jgi:hypothetical protein
MRLIRSRHWYNQIDTGANASAEEADEALEDSAVQVNNVVNSFRLQSTSFDKKSYLSHLKGMLFARWALRYWSLTII